MPVQFFELPAGQGSPVVTQVATITGYCTASDVASLNKARQIGQGNNPTLTDVNGYIEMTAGQIDAILVNKGYSVPVNTASNPEAEGLLSWVNATAAWKMMEEASPNSPNIDRAARAADAAMKMLADAQFVMDLPMNQARAEPRGPWITFTPTERVFDPQDAEIGFRNSGCNDPSLPLFSRSMRF